MRTEASTTSSDTSYVCYVKATSWLTIWILTPTLLFCFRFSFGASSHHMTSTVGINIYSCVINIQHTFKVIQTSSCWLCFWSFVLSEQEIFCHKPECDCAHTKEIRSAFRLILHYEMLTAKCTLWNALCEMLTAEIHFVKCSSMWCQASLLEMHLFDRSGLSAMKCSSPFWYYGNQHCYCQQYICPYP